MPSALAAEVKPRCSATAWKVRSDVKLIAISNSSHGIFEFGNGRAAATLPDGRTGMWRYSNPVAITFGAGAFAELPKLIAGQPYALVTYPDARFAALAEQLRRSAGDPVVTVSDVAPNPDTRLLAVQSARFGAAGEPKIILALGGGSGLDTAKGLAAARGGFQPVLRYLQTGSGAEALSATPIIAVPTTAGTGSEVTSWATVWGSQSGKKY